MPTNPPPPPPARQVVVVGIGAGHPAHLTLAAVDALNRCDAVLLVDKGADAADLHQARLELCHRVIEPGRRWRTIEAALPGVAARGSTAYGDAVRAWRSDRVAAYADLVRQLAPGETGVFLAWGDPGLYDPTLAILEDARRHLDGRLGVEVVPGISAPAALAARFGIALTRQGGDVLVTTGRRLAAHGWPTGVDTVAVLLDTHDALGAVDDDVHVWWAAYLGLPGERLVSGRVGDVRDAIGDARAAGRAEHGWLFDTYVLRRP